MAGIVYGYARVSTRGQAENGNGIEAQQDALKAAVVQGENIHCFKNKYNYNALSL